MIHGNYFYIFQLWESVTTYHPYHEEVFHGSSNPASKNQKKEKVKQQSTGIQNILRSLAPRHAEVIKELASLQLAQFEQNGQTLIPYKTLFKNCQRNMFISSDLALRNVLRELEDHHIVEYQQQDEGEMIYIQFDVDMLKTIIDFRRR